MSNKRKTATAVAATAAAAAVLLTGTYAWQNLNQEALNASAGVVNPGGRLHDDFNGTNKDVYVENFADENIYARIQLTEYMEIGTGAGLDFTSDERNVTVLTSREGTESSYADKSTWQIHKIEENETDKYWTWTYGGNTIYMPTFNMNKDSLVADINGTFEGEDGTDGAAEKYDEQTGKYTDQEDRYSDYETYTEGQTLEGKEVYDADTNDVDEGEGAVVGTNIREVEAQTHTAKSTEHAEVVSMEKWMYELSDEEKEANGYWVYDTDGWAYWSKPIAPDTATGLLLNGIELTGVVDDNWYYAINVTAQFITANDIGLPTDKNPAGSGFYDTAKGTEPSADALALLESIGVKTTNDDVENQPQGNDTIIIRVDDTSEYATTGYLKSDDTLQLSAVVMPADGSEPDLSTIVWEVEDPKNTATLEKNEQGALLTVNGDSTNTVPYHIVVSATYGETTNTANILVSENEITTSVSREGSEELFYTEEILYTNEEYTFIASTLSGSESVALFDSWNWEVLEENTEGEKVPSENATITDGVFSTTTPGTYTIAAYPVGNYALKAETTITVYNKINLSLPEGFVDLAKGSTVVVTMDGELTNDDVTWDIDLGTGAGHKGGITPGEGTSNTATVENGTGICGGSSDVPVTVTSNDGMSKGMIYIPFNC